MLYGKLEDTFRGVSGQHIRHGVNLVQDSDSFRVLQTPCEITFFEG